jgi:hypothetical protein
MKSSFWTIGLLSVIALACSPAPGKNDGGDDGGETGEFFVNVSGRAYVHPVGEKYLADAGLPPLSLVGLTVQVQEPLKVAVMDPDGVFGSVVLDGGGTFAVANVSTDLVNLGIAAGVRDERDAGISPITKSATVLYDVILIGEKPRADITNGKAYAVPRQFHDALTAAVGEANIKALTGTTNRKTLFEAGFTLGRIIDSSGNPVSGLTVTPIPSNLANRLFYPTADLSGTQASTSVNGIFLYVHTGGDVQTFRYTVPGHAEYKERRAGAVKDACLVTEVYPGLTPPP